MKRNLSNARAQILSSEDKESLTENTLSTAEKKVSRVCPECRRVLEETWKGCPYCGKDLTGSQKLRGTIYGILSILVAVLSLIVPAPIGLILGLAAFACGFSAIEHEDTLGIAGIFVGGISALLSLYNIL